MEENEPKAVTPSEFGVKNEKKLRQHLKEDEEKLDQVSYNLSNTSNKVSQNFEKKRSVRPK